MESSIAMLVGATRKSKLFSRWRQLDPCCCFAPENFVKLTLIVIGCMWFFIHWLTRWALLCAHHVTLSYVTPVFSFFNDYIFLHKPHPQFLSIPLFCFFSSTMQMSESEATPQQAEQEKKANVEVTEKEQPHKIRIVLSSRDHKSLEKGTWICCCCFFQHNLTLA